MSFLTVSDFISVVGFTVCMRTHLWYGKLSTVFLALVVLIVKGAQPDQ